ncbi:MAG TPA: hypothetical protein VGL65_13260 [Gemmatimonadales bacterium]|jgi:hypothetical protein
MTITVIVAAAAFSACSFSPLAHRIDVGQEPFVIFVGEGIDHHTDLFAAPAGGGEVAQLTFTALIERHPRLSPSGDVVAFIRMRDTLPGTQHDVVAMNLLSGGEMTIALPAAAGQADDLAWSGDTVLYVRTDHGVWRAAAPPAHGDATPVIAPDSARADSVLSVWLGQPRFARVVNCSTAGLCIIGPKGDTGLLAPQGRDAIRWGDDSVAWFEDGAVMVRSLGPGRERRVNWRSIPDHPRDGTYAPGPPPPAP